MAAKKTDDVFAMPSFDASKMTDSIREFAEKGAAQSKEAYAKIKTVAEDASKTVEETMKSAQAGSVELGLKVIETARTNTDNALTHIEAMMGVKTVAELFELQTAFVRKQYEVAMEQAKSMQEIVKTVSETVAKPGKAAVEKTMSAFKAA